eukprot:g3540.t1
MMSIDCPEDESLVPANRGIDFRAVWQLTSMSLGVGVFAIPYCFHVLGVLQGVQESSGFQKLIGSYSKSFGVPLDDNNLQGFAEEMCRCCLREADDVMFDDGPLAAALQEVQHYKQKLNECNLAAVKQIAAMRDGCHLSESLKEDTVNFHEPLTFMDEEQQRLVIAVVCDKIRQLQNGTAPPSLVEALTRYAETIVKQEEAAGLDEILEIQSGLQKHIENLMSAVERREKIIQEHAEETHQLQEELTTERSSREALQAELAEASVLASVEQSDLKGARQILAGTENKESKVSEKGNGHNRDEAGHSSPPRGPPEALGRMNSSVSLPSLRRSCKSKARGVLGFCANTAIERLLDCAQIHSRSEYEEIANTAMGRGGKLAMAFVIGITTFIASLSYLAAATELLVCVVFAFLTGEDINKRGGSTAILSKTKRAIVLLIFVIISMPKLLKRSMGDNAYISKIGVFSMSAAAIVFVGNSDPLMKPMTSVAASNMPVCSSQLVGDKAAACGSVESAAQSMRAVVRTSIAFSPELGQSLVLPAFGIEDELKVTCAVAGVCSLLLVAIVGFPCIESIELFFKMARPDSSRDVRVAIVCIVGIACVAIDAFIDTKIAFALTGALGLSLGAYVMPALLYLRLRDRSMAGSAYRFVSALVLLCFGAVVLLGGTPATVMGAIKAHEGSELGELEQYGKRLKNECIAMQSAGSRQRYPYPETSYQEHGWLLLPPGDAVARTFKKKLRRGIGWEWKDPCDWSESNPAAPIIPKEAPEGAEATSCVSAAPPSVLSVLTSIPESQILALQNGSGVKTKAAQVAATAAPAKKPSILSASAPNILAPRFGIPSSASELSASTVSKASSTDAILDPAERLRRREVKLAERLKDAWAYQNGGCKGQKWYHPLGQTDATRFADEFTKATGGVWPGKILFPCGGRCVTAYPSGPAACAWSFILVPCGFYCLFVGRLWTEWYPLVPLAAACVFLLTTTFLCLTCCSDPGIIPRRQMIVAAGLDRDLKELLGYDVLGTGEPTGQADIDSSNMVPEELRKRGFKCQHSLGHVAHGFLIPECSSKYDVL